jgi:hypothetical protein
VTGFEPACRHLGHAGEEAFERLPVAKLTREEAVVHWEAPACTAWPEQSFASYSLLEKRLRQRKP